MEGMGTRRKRALVSQVLVECLTSLCTLASRYALEPVAGAKQSDSKVVPRAGKNGHGRHGNEKKKSSTFPLPGRVSHLPMYSSIQVCPGAFGWGKNRCLFEDSKI